MSEDPRLAPDGAYAWRRLALALAISTVAGVGMWAIIVVLPAVQAEFGVDRASASIPYVATMAGFAFGTLWLGGLADRIGIVAPLAGAGAALGLGFAAAATTSNLWVFTLVHVLIGLGAGAGFAPMIADVSHWFVRRRGLAVAIVASGNYLAGTVWPLLMNAGMAQFGWRATYLAIGIVVAAAVVPGAFLFSKRPSERTLAAAQAATEVARAGLALSPRALQALLILAGFGCCMAMAVPQVHIVAYCGDLGYGVARGAEMLSLMLGLGIVSRIASGLLADRLGGPMTLLIGSVMQGVALVLYLFFDGLASLYVISALFGLFQGGIVPMYAVIIREFLPPREAGARIGLVLSATIIGMAAGGWVAGAIFDWTGSYRLAFLHAVGWNLVNVAIVSWLAMRRRAPEAPVPRGAAA